MLRSGIFVGDRYEIIELAGSGGMSEVYKAKDHKLNRFVAMKVLKRELSEDKNFVSKFRIEAQSAAGLSHPNIVNVYDVGNEDGIYYIVMELVDGITLKEYIQKKVKIPIKEAISIAIQISLGIENAHNNHIIHRDIKPQNIIISRDGKVKVTDFGIARAASTETIASNIMGSVHYTSPEQARGGYSDEKSDIYSLGITIYEMITGRVPFDGDTTVNIAIQHLQDEIEPPRTFAPEIPGSLEQIVLKCTQKVPSRRYANMGELIKDLKQSLVTPEGDFVKVISFGNTDKTRLMSSSERSEIQNEAAKGKGKIKTKDTVDLYEDNEDDEEDEDEEVNPKLEKLMTVLGIIAAVIIASIALYLIGQAAGIFKFGPSSKKQEPTEIEETQDQEEPEEKTTVTMPKILGKTLEEAKQELNALGLGIKEEASEFSDLYEKDQISKQSIAEGEEVDKNTTILVTISKGIESFSLPSVEGLEENAAKNTLEDYELVVTRDYSYNDSVKAGVVISTNPGAGTSVVKGDTVAILVSRGREVIEVNVPDLRNQSESEARNALNSAGLAVGTVSEANSETVPAGAVISQSYSAGTKVEAGTAVDFVLSLGPKEKPVERYIGTVRIENPFAEGVESGVVTLRLTQQVNGSEVTTTVSEEHLSRASFPYTRQMEGAQGVTTGIVKVYVDGAEINGTYSVTFSPAN